MAIEASDIQPSDFQVIVRDKKYTSKPTKLAHRIILMKLNPLFDALFAAAENKPIKLSSSKLLEFQSDLDSLLNDLIPDLKDITLGADDLVDLVQQILNNSLPEESKQLADEGVALPADPKAEKTG